MDARFLHDEESNQKPQHRVSWSVVRTLYSVTSDSTVAGVSFFKAVITLLSLLQSSLTVTQHFMMQTFLISMPAPYTRACTHEYVI